MPLPSIRRWLALAAVLAAAGAGAGAALFWHLGRPTGGPPVAVSIDEGMSARAIGVRLEAVGLVRSARYFEAAARWRGLANRLEAGRYRLDGSRSPSQLLDDLLEAPLQMVRVTIPEGLTRRQTAGRLRAAGLADSARFMAATESPRLISDLGVEAGTLEGYLFPETYFLPPEVTEEEIVRHMVAEFHRVLDDSLAARLPQLGLSLHEAVTLASIVEGEAMAADERPVISAIFHRLAVRRRSRPPVEVEVDEELIAALVEVAARPDVKRATGGHWTVGDLLGFPQVVTVAERTAELADDPDVETAVTNAVAEALGELDRMRTNEGAHLRADLDERLVALGRLIDRIEQGAGDGAEALGQRLAARLAEIGPDVRADQAALAQEVVRFVARSDIHEELTRLRAHVSHWAALADASEPCGRKLDFLLQEMNREVNTVGSKADGHETSGLVVAAKAELEKLREQTQNVE